MEKTQQIQPTNKKKRPVRGSRVIYQQMAVIESLQDHESLNDPGGGISAVLRSGSMESRSPLTPDSLT